MKTPVYIRHKIGQCAICAAPLLDAGWTDDPRSWTHARPWGTEVVKPKPIPYGVDPIGYGICDMILSRVLDIL